MLGLYPVVTQPMYLLSAPWFSDVNITLGASGASHGDAGGNGGGDRGDKKRTLRITAMGLGQESYYIKGVKINGVKWRKNWVGHEVVAEGGWIEFELGSEHGVWEEDGGPPSPGRMEGGGT
jgi:putative alpha-1,2-mannosidase